MPIVAISPVGQTQLFDNLGQPLSGGKVFYFEGDSFSTLADIYTTAAGDESAANPVVCDTSGRPAATFLEVDITYNIVVTKSDGTTVLQSWELVSGAPTLAAVQDLIDASIDGFVPDTGGTITGSLTVTGVLNGGSVVSNSTITAGGNISAPGVISDGIDADSGKIINVDTPTDATDAANKAYVDSVAASGGAPLGSVTAWPVTTPPANWLICDGTPVSRTTYASLFAILGTLYGSGDGTTTFNLPDYRGSFLRGLDSGAGLDPARALATYQADDYAAHTHTINADDGGFNVGTNNVSGTDRTTTSYTPPTNSSGGSETRPKNWSVQFIIRAL